MSANDIAAREERARIVTFIRARVQVLDGFMKNGSYDDRIVHSAQILALHEAARLIENGEETWR